MHLLRAPRVALTSTMPHANINQAQPGSGDLPLTITATFGSGKTKDVVTQAFTLTVVS